MKTLTLAVLGFIASWAYGANPNPRDLVKTSISNYEKDWNASLDFTYTEHDISKDPSGRIKTAEISQVSVLDGTPYNRLIGKNGQPLTIEEEEKENEKYRKAETARDSETAEQHARRIRKYEEERSFLSEIPDAFDMKMLGEETIGGRSCYVIGLTPKSGYVAKSKSARMFSDIEGRLWIDEQDLRWAQAEATVTNTISIGWVLARIDPGAQITLKQVKVDSEHWLLKEICVKGEAKIMLVKTRTIDETVSCADYKRVRQPAGTAAAKNH